MDFTVEVERSLRVLDGVIALFDSVAGVEPQTETVWRQADKYGVPRICFVNKMDRVGADLFRCVDMISERLGAVPLIMQLPIGIEADHIGVVDLVTMEALTWRDENLGAEFVRGEIPAELAGQAASYREKLLETAVEQDDDVLEAYLGGVEPDAAALRRCVRNGTIAGAFVPVLCGASFKNKGVQPLLDAVVDYLPAPTDVPPIHGTRPDSEEVVQRGSTDDAPFAALAFKIMSDPFVGSLTFVRVYSGTIETGKQVLNSTRGKRSRLGRMLLMHANRREDVKEAHAGDIIALAGMRTTTTGDTLCDPGNPVILERIEFPEPVIEVAVEPRTKADQEKMSQALSRLASEDPSFRVASDPESGQTVIAGMGELHLEVLVDRMKREFKVDANVGAPQVAYRETIANRVETDYTHRKQTGGAGQFARVKVVFEPLESGSGYQFENAVRGGAVPKEFVPGVEKGLRDSRQSGVLAGFPVIDFKAILVDGQAHEVDSSSLAFEIASRSAFREGMLSANPVLLEPVMKVEVVTPEEYMGDVIGDLNSRRGQVSGMDARGNSRVITAMVPLATMFGYVNGLRSMTQGRATFTMHFGSYAPVPQEAAQEMQVRTA